MYIVDIFLDNRSSRYVKSIWEQLSKSGIDSSLINTDGLSPHITLAIYEKIDEEKFIVKMKEFKSKIKVVDTRFDILGVFPDTGACFTTPVVTDELLNLHKEYYEYFKEFEETARLYYLPGKWNPHCSLAMGLNKQKMKEAFDFVLDIFEPFEASLDGIALYKVEMENGKFTDSIRLF
ncbi:MAG: 2'-5' RNA ligase family protein [Clostridium sp.]|uniref:2'-5' RNA ligase family protein n=1 Tax=Clostridium sp. TaxID=1506 RepID=UPI003F3DBE5B